MTEQELINELKKMYETADDKKQVASIHLFGIKYADELKNKSLKNIAEQATGKSSYYSEINKGMSLKSLLNESNLLKSNIIKDDIVNNNLFKTKNIMLYGSPGVGKTHNYKRLITMIENGSDEKTIFDTISKNETTNNFDNATFETIKNEKRIEFVTFHQSYSYEDFIEGFRPQDDGKIELEDGIFKRISFKANNNFIASLIKGDRNIPFDELINKFVNYVQDFLDNDKSFYINESITIKSINKKGAFLLGGSVKSPQRLALDIINRDYSMFKDGLIKSYEDIKPKFDSQSNFHGNARYYFMFYKKLFEFEQNLDKTYISLEPIKQKNFYIVIDEINRGNISKIFGELITLIEEDKRDDYEVTLPYSKEKFKIPSNLYIIATMNSTDKSIATIDIALRRRFTFLKMKPNLDLVKNENAKDLMQKLNEHISKTISEDYALGHSYFMKIVDEEDLEFVKEYKIKPLLEEYFYGDETNYKKALEILE